MKLKKFLMVLFSFILISSIGCDNATNNSSSSTIEITTNNNETTIETTDIEKIYTYDDLQKLFIAINEETTIDDLLELINEKNLCYTDKEYGSSKCIVYRIAYNDNVAIQSYGDDGDVVEVEFSTNDSTLNHVTYFNSKGFLTALFYVKGIYYDFSDNMLKDYKGYYLNDYKNDNNGISLKYSNGNEKQTNYCRYYSARSVLNTIIDNVN